MESTCKINLPGYWITAGGLEQALKQKQDLLIQDDLPVVVHFHKYCKVMVDAAVRLLSLANQFVAMGRSVTFVFDGRWNETLGYLGRANFFSLLSEQVKVVPARPDPIMIANYRGMSQGLVEFQSVHPRGQEGALAIPRQLTDVLVLAMGERPDIQQLRHTAFTIFAELIDNIYNHSQTILDGIIGLQVYRNGGEAQVVVSDSGIGLLQTVRAKLSVEENQYLGNVDVISKLFRDGISWDESRRGLGLRQCAHKAIKHHATVTIRLTPCSVQLAPSAQGYQAVDLVYHQDVPFLQGTHICFHFPLT
jgi:signal transduction histidine kinase